MAVYHNTTLGHCLMDALDDLAQETTLSTPVTKTIMSQFEKSMSAALEQVPHTADLRGSAYTFQMVSDVWKLSSPQLRGRVGGADINATNILVVLSVSKAVEAVFWCWQCTFSQSNLKARLLHVTRACVPKSPSFTSLALLATFLLMMSAVNALVGSACGAVFLCDWLIARSRTPRALINAKRRLERTPITDEGYHGPASEQTTPVSTTVAAMRKEDFAKLRNALLLATPVGLLLGLLGTLFAEHLLSLLPGTWSFGLATGALVGLGFPAFLQIWALSMDLLHWVRTGKSTMNAPLLQALVETIDISVHEHQMFNPSLYIIFILSGCGCGALVAAGRLIYQHKSFHAPQ